MSFTAFTLTAVFFYLLGVTAGHNKENWKEE